MKGHFIIQRTIRAKTLFATHYHELTELASQLEGVRNLHVSVKESGDQILFLRRVVFLWIEEDDLTSQPVEVERHVNELVQPFADSPLTLRLRKQQHESAPSGAEHLAANRSSRERLGVDVLDLAV